MKVKTITTNAVLMALAVILGFFSIQLTDNIKISVAFMPNELSGMLFGPFVGAIFGGTADILKYIVKPTGAYFPGFTISGIISGAIYGFVLYKKNITLTRILFANFIVTFFVNMLLNTYWLTLFYGNGFMAILPARIIKQAIMYPIDVTLFFLLYKVLTVSRRELFSSI